MQLFKTEMLFLHPPRTRTAYSVRALRYGRRTSVRSSQADPPSLSDDWPRTDAPVVLITDETTVGMDRAA